MPLEVSERVILEKTNEVAYFRYNMSAITVSRAPMGLANQAKLNVTKLNH
jgi:hypothetical protein